MKKILKPTLAIGLSLLVTACSSQKREEIKLEPEQVILKDGSTIGTIYVTQDDRFEINIPNERITNLRLITSGHNSMATAGDVTKTIFCNPLSLFNLIGECTAKIYSHDKEELIGDKTPIQNIAYSYGYPKYKELLQQNLKVSRKGNYIAVPIYFIPAENYLIFEDKGYKLTAGFNIYVQYSNLNSMFKCKESKGDIPLEKWQANNYELAISEGKKLLGQCFKRLDDFHFENIGELIERQRKEFL